MIHGHIVNRRAAEINLNLTIGKKKRTEERK
jgi:hypothetical protein